MVKDVIDAFHCQAVNTVIVMYRSSAYAIKDGTDYSVQIVSFKEKGVLSLNRCGEFFFFSSIHGSHLS